MEKERWENKSFVDVLKNFLRRCKMADDSTSPRSYRGVTYKEIVSAINSGKSNVYVFRHMYPKTQEELENIIRWLNFRKKPLGIK